MRISALCVFTLYSLLQWNVMLGWSKDTIINVRINFSKHLFPQNKSNQIKMKKQTKNEIYSDRVKKKLRDEIDVMYCKWSISSCILNKVFCAIWAYNNIGSTAWVKYECDRQCQKFVDFILWYKRFWKCMRHTYTCKDIYTALSVKYSQNK